MAMDMDKLDKDAKKEEEPVKDPDALPMELKEVRTALQKENLDERMGVLTAYDDLIQQKLALKRKAEQMAKDLEQRESRIRQLQETNQNLFMRIPTKTEEKDVVGMPPRDVKIKTLDDFIAEAQKEG